MNSWQEAQPEPANSSFSLEGQRGRRWDLQQGFQNLEQDPVRAISGGPFPDCACICACVYKLRAQRADHSSLHILSPVMVSHWPHLLCVLGSFLSRGLSFPALQGLGGWAMLDSLGTSIPAWSSSEAPSGSFPPPPTHTPIPPIPEAPMSGCKQSLLDRTGKQGTGRIGSFLLWAGGPGKV